MANRTDEALTPLAHSANNRCFGCGEANPAGLRLKFFQAADGAVVCTPAIPETFVGYPGFLHGGILATLLDEAMSKSVRALGRTAMTARIEIDYRRPAPSGTPLRVEGRVVRSEGRKHWTEAVITDAEGQTLVQGKGLFLEIKALTAQENTAEARDDTSPK